MIFNNDARLGEWSQSKTLHKGVSRENGSNTSINKWDKRIHSSSVSGFHLRHKDKSKHETRQILACAYCCVCTDPFTARN